MEGAGIRGLAYAGAIQGLEKQGVSQSVKHIAGTSAGAITAVLLALHYSSSEIETIISSTPFQRFNASPGYFIGGFIRLKKKYGYYQTRRFETWMADLIEAKCGNRYITLEELHQRGFSDIYLLTTCINLPRTLCLSYRTFPKMRLVDAVTASMAIPLYFEPVVVNQEGVRMSISERSKEAFLLVDGGLAANFPLHVFDTIPGIQPENTLGIKIDSDEQRALDRTMQHLVPQSCRNVRDYVHALYVYGLETMNCHAISESDVNRVLVLSDAHVGLRVKKLSRMQQSALIRSAIERSEAFFDVKNKGKVEK